MKNDDSFRHDTYMTINREAKGPLNHGGSVAKYLQKKILILLKITILSKMVLELGIIFKIIKNFVFANLSFGEFQASKIGKIVTFDLSERQHKISILAQIFKNPFLVSIF